MSSLSTLAAIEVGDFGPDDSRAVRSRHLGTGVYGRSALGQRQSRYNVRPVDADQRDNCGLPLMFILLLFFFNFQQRTTGGLGNLQTLAPTRASPKARRKDTLGWGHQIVSTMSVLRTVWMSAQWSRRASRIWLQKEFKQAGRCHFSHLRKQNEEAQSTFARFRPEDIQFPAYKGHCARAFIINGATTQMLSSMLVHPAPNSPVPKYMRLASYSFLVESHHRSQKVLFDLAFMKDLFTRMPPSLKAMLDGDADVVDPVMKIENICDVPDTLQAYGYDLSAVNSVIWSHAHIDHVGDPSVFPSTTELVVGPRFKSTYMPGYPINPEAMVLDSAFRGRSVKELDFDEGNPNVANIGGFRAVDFWRDGSFWLLECPGHTGHHLGALCRTTPNSWVFMGADCSRE